jgi:hypothetical protein
MLSPGALGGKTEADPLRGGQLKEKAKAKTRNGNLYVDALPPANDSHRFAVAHALDEVLDEINGEGFGVGLDLLGFSSRFDRGTAAARVARPNEYDIEAYL